MLSGWGMYNSEAQGNLGLSEGSSQAAELYGEDNKEQRGQVAQCA